MPQKTTPGRGRRVLLVANDTVSEDELVRRRRESAGEGGSIFVVAPAIVSSALKHHLGDMDQARGPAEERLERTLSQREEGGRAVTRRAGPTRTTFRGSLGSIWPRS